MTVTPFPAPEGAEGTTSGEADGTDWPGWAGWTDGAVLRGGMGRLRVEAGWVREGTRQTRNLASPQFGRGRSPVARPMRRP